MEQETEPSWWRSAERRARCKELRTHQTTTEREAWKLLRSRQAFGLRFRRQHPIGPYVADFACLAPRLVIELDGPVHQDRVAQDRERDQAIRALGYGVVRIKNEEFSANPACLMAKIQAAIDMVTPPAHGNGEGVGGRGCER